MKSILIAVLKIMSVLWILAIAITYSIWAVIPWLSMGLGIYLVKKIYFDRKVFGYEITSSKSKQLIISVIVFIISVLIAGVCFGFNIVMLKEKKQAELNEAANAVYEEIKDLYSQEEYDSVKKKLYYMKTNYSSTAAYSRAFSEFGDYEKKEKEKREKKEAAKRQAQEEWLKKAKVEWEEHGQELINGYVDLLSGISGVKEVFYNVYSNGGEVDVLVNDNWYSMNKEAKKGFIQRAVVLWRGRLKCSRSMPSWQDTYQDFKFINKNSGRVVATYKQSWGPSIKE